MSIDFYIEVSGTELAQGGNLMVGPNMANATAAALLGALGERCEPCGWWRLEDLPRVRQGLLRIANGEAVKRFTQEASESTGTGGAQFVDCGVPLERLQRKAAALAELIADAQSMGRGVYWG